MRLRLCPAQRTRNALQEASAPPFMETALSPASNQPKNSLSERGRDPEGGGDPVRQRQKGTLPDQKACLPLGVS